MWKRIKSSHVTSFLFLIPSFALLILHYALDISNNVLGPTEPGKIDGTLFNYAMLYALAIGISCYAVHTALLIPIRVPILIAKLSVVPLVWLVFAMYSMPSSPHFVSDTTKWPSPLRRVVDSTPSIAESIQVYSIQSLPDLKSIWLVDNENETMDAFVRENSLEKTTLSHTKFQDLISCRPSKWAHIVLADSEVFATPGFGEIHQEGVDLFLVARDKNTGVTIVLHEWNF